MYFFSVTCIFRFSSRASGHVDRFADLMVKDVKNGECFRLDHLIKSALEKISREKKTTDNVKNEISDILIKVRPNLVLFLVNSSLRPSTVCSSKN